MMMLNSDDKKKDLGAVIVARMHPKGADEDSSDVSGGDAINAAATALIDAVHSKDASAVADSIKELVGLCKDAPEEKDDAEDSDKPSFINS